MLNNHISADKSSTSFLRTFWHRRLLPSRWMVRILIALTISWLIAMVFFVTSVASH